MKLVVICNGPAGSGKDELATMLTKAFSFIGQTKHCQFKDALYDQTCNVFEITKSRLLELCNNRDTKEVETPELTFRGRQFSPRGALIHTSENLIKPHKGKDFFGKKAAEGLVDGLNVFSDGGFVEELKPIVDAVGASNVMILRIIRPGYTFEGDSRKHLTMTELVENDMAGVGIHPLFNNKTLLEFREEGVEIVGNFVSEAVIKNIKEGDEDA